MRGQQNIKKKVLHSAVKISLWPFLNCRIMLMSIFNSAFQSVPCTSNNTWHARQCRRLNHSQSEKVLGLFCPNYVEVRLAVWLQGKNLLTETSWNLYYNQAMMHIHQKMKTFLLRVSVTLTMTQMMSETQTSHNGLTIQTANLLYLYYTGL